MKVVKLLMILVVITSVWTIASDEQPERMMNLVAVMGFQCYYMYTISND